jgi:type I restriction enzyme S subunit
MIPEIIPEFQEMPLNAMTDLFIDGDWIESKDMSDSGIRVIQTGNIGIGEVLEKSDKARYISQSTFERLNCTALQSGDILICRLADPVGRCVQVPEWMDGSVTSVDVTIVRCDVEIIRPRFLMYLLNSEETLGRVRASIQGTTRGRISRSKLGELLLTIPCSLEIQDSIISILDNVESLTTVKRTLIKKLGYIREGMLNDFLSYGIDEHGTLRSPETHNFVESPVGLIPETWNVLRGDQLFTCGSGHAPVEIDLSDNGTALFLKASDLSRPENRNVVITSKLRYYPENQNTRINSFPENSIVFAKRGEAIRQNRVRRVGCTVSVDSNLMVLECYNVNPQFFVELLTHMNIETLLESSTLPQINNKHLYPKLFAIPPRKEQDYIIERTNSIGDRKDSEITLLDKYSAIKQGLMNDLLTGRMRVPTPAPDGVEVAA